MTPYPPLTPAAPFDPAEAYAAACLTLQAAESTLDDVLERLTDDNVREPSLLPGWTRGHVVTHLARGADAIATVTEGFIDGQPRPAYASAEQRDADIEAGSRRRVDELRDDVRKAQHHLRATISRLGSAGSEALSREVEVRGTTLAGWQVPGRRTREIHLHAFDLDLGYDSANWPAGFVDDTLTELATTIAARADTTIAALADATTGTRWPLGGESPTISGQPHELLAWLTGRGPSTGLQLHPAGPLPAPPAWS